MMFGLIEAFILGFQEGFEEESKKHNPKPILKHNPNKNNKYFKERYSNLEELKQKRIKIIESLESNCSQNTINEINKEYAKVYSEIKPKPEPKSSSRKRYWYQLSDAELDNIDSDYENYDQQCDEHWHGDTSDYYGDGDDYTYDW